MSDGSVTPPYGTPPETKMMGANSRRYNKGGGDNTGNILTGKQEHYLKRELISRQTKSEIAELNSPTALRRFGAPFKSDLGEVSPTDSDLPILRFIFVHHVRKFPFLDQAKEKEFWQDKLQVFLESFATKQISSSEDRLEETKRRKLALKCEKLVELMMNSGIPTASGYEERVSFEEIEVVDRDARDESLMVNVPEGHVLNGWDVNVVSVRQTSVKRTVRYHTHAEFLIRSKHEKHGEVLVGRRYGSFKQLTRDLKKEFPGKVFPPLPIKTKASSGGSTGLLTPSGAIKDDDSSSISSVSTIASTEVSSRRLSAPFSHSRSASASRNSRSVSRNRSSLNSERGDSPPQENSAPLWREDQRVSLRAYLRNLLKNQQIATSAAMKTFLTESPVKLNREEEADEQRRRLADQARVDEQMKFFEIARSRARELDAYMEGFRREIVEANGLTNLFAEIKEKNHISELSPNYQKFAEWARIEVAATIYHLFLAEDNSPELFAQMKRIHSLIPYAVLKNIIRIANPAAVMSGVLDLFLAQPFKSRSLMQRVFGMAISDGVNQVQKAIDALWPKVGDAVLCDKIKQFAEASDDVREIIREDAAADDVDILVAILRSELLEPELSPEQIGTVFNAYVAWTNAVNNVDDEMRQGAVLFSHLKQLLKLYTRRRDKMMMQALIEEPVTLQLFRDLFHIFYEPLVRVYKSANVYNSITDFAHFLDDIIVVVEKAQKQDLASDPNKTVQAFIDLCARHEDNFFKFIHEVHLHDNGLFSSLMGWIEDILAFLRNGPKRGALDMNKLFEDAVAQKVIDSAKAKAEIDSLIKWQFDRKRWHEGKTRQKMASGRDNWSETKPGGFSVSDFGLEPEDLADLAIDDAEMDEDLAFEEELDDADLIAVEQKRRNRQAEILRRTAGQPVKPPIDELHKMGDVFLVALKNVLSED
ncbi:hypothetical protein TWF225_008917 [Orbilia oligospora]|uniref:Uncharacterized protein n=1 Tax=Orbilia oligospora TaxID=2813651 RepID=A0A7C8K0B8_ORBOL|nr:hypothetical protein TWF751_001572 [Orbilia oligospora]KAF3175410.1 hypothetical protein TWF225_008917 [Orbilia oligospora]KAF3253084.1 hypothetical protein TWF128_006532 [Orbilia oligospora]KAF3266943.1 hypothetical protein TWF217_001027 [Orbilia oligospora]KAF3292150.1 hypothetical protein TWF132_005826 [Orbilia oligospora]